MDAIILIFLAIFGMVLGSFGSVLVSRLKTGEKGIVDGRSHCPNCNHTLGAKDLVPIVSYLLLGAKCSYCKKPISPVYPALEIVMGFCFFLAGLYLVDVDLLFSGDIKETVRLFFFLAIIFTFVITAFYDILYQEIPVKLISWMILVNLCLLIAAHFDSSLGFIFGHFRHFENQNLNGALVNGLLGAFFIYTFFYIQILLPGLYYAYVKKRGDIARLELIEYFTIPFWMLISAFSDRIGFNEEEVEEETESEPVYTFMGHGDLWIAVLMGLSAGFKKAIMGLALAYLIGSIMGVYILAKRRQRHVLIAFGPFLAAGIILSLIGYDFFIDTYFGFLGTNF